ncbi:hypothetical protein Pelo_11335 [Pelomyxa schiedti]|nr:hypothetical protein Pelo_11335 [Pelomyxa schiedti]
MSSSTTSPPVASISGNTMGNALSAEETALPFVDRNIEIELLIRWARFNACNRTSLKPTTLFSSQLFGSGKTYFAHNAIGYLRKDFASRGPITTSLICPGAVAPEDDRCDLSLLRNQPSSPFTEELVSQYANSGTVIVDVSRMESLPGATFDTVLVYYIASKVTGRDPAALFREHYCDTLAQLHEKMQAIKEGYWFICFDEIGALEDKAIQRHFSLEEFNCYSPLLTFLQKLLDVSDYKIFFFLCGRSWKLIQITLGKTLNSPVRLRYLALGALSVKDIETILRASPICVYIKEDEFTSISQTLFNLSGGVPRFIQLMYLALLADARNRGRSSVTQILLSAKEVEAKLHPSSKFGGDIMDNTSLVTDTVSSSASQEELAMHETTLLRLYILGALIPSREVVSILSVFPCYITPVGDAFKPIFSPYWIEKMKSRDHISVPALNLSSLLKTAPPALDQGRIFELLGAEVISSRLLLAQQRTFGGALSFLQDTVLGGVHISERASPDSPVLFPLGVVPSLNVCTTPGEPTEHSFNAEDWDLFITHLEQNWINHIALASSAPSHGPDLLIPLACCPDGNNVLFGDEARKITHIVEFAFKNIQGGVADAKDMQSWSHIRKEVAKCLDAPRKCGAKTSGVHFTLVFISTELTSAVFKVIQRYQSPALVLRSTDDGRKWRVSGSELVEVSYEEAHLTSRYRRTVSWLFLEPPLSKHYLVKNLSRA